MKLTTRKALALTKPGLYGDGETLFLRVAPGGSKQWVQRLTIKGKRHDLGLGPYPLIGIERARIDAMRNRLTVYDGGDPLADRRRATMPTYREADIKVLTAKAATWKGDQSANAWRRSIAMYVLPIIGDMPLDEVTQQHVLSILTPIWTAKPAVARKLRQRMTAVFEWAMAHRLVSKNPAGEAINGALPRTKAVKEHFRALAYQDMPDALRSIEASTGSLAARLALQFVALTAARCGEVRGAVWDEVDIDSATWVIPAARMKSAREHRVPLSVSALELLGRARELRDDSGLLFPSPMRPGETLSNGTLNHTLKTTGLEDRTTVHGFRSTFRNWCADSGKDREIAESALAHVVGGTEGSYMRADLFDRRRRLMRQWADYLTGGRGAVVQLHG